MRAVGVRLDQGDRGQPLGMARGAGRHGIDDQPIAVLHQRVAHEGEPGFLAAALPGQPCVGVGGRGVGVVRAALAVKIALAVPARAGGSPEPSFGLKLFGLAQASSSVPSTEKCSLDNSPFTLLVRQHRGEKLRRNLAVEQPVAVLGEAWWRPKPARRCPDRQTSGTAGR